MESIHIFLVVMSCSLDTLSCENVSEMKAYRNVSLCHEARAQVLGNAQRLPGSERTLFAKCQYVLADSAAGDKRTPAEWESARRLAW